MPDPYADTDELATWLGEAAPANADALLERASAFLDAVINAAFTVDDETGLPTDTDVAAAMSDAACAQVEYWIAVGVEIDIEGSAGKQVSVGGLSMRLPERLAPRAEDALRSMNLLVPA